jgi:hypothetical protein
VHKFEKYHNILNLENSSEVRTLYVFNFSLLFFWWWWLFTQIANYFLVVFVCVCVFFSFNFKTHCSRLKGESLVPELATILATLTPKADPEPRLSIDFSFSLEQGLSPFVRLPSLSWAVCQEWGHNQWGLRPLRYTSGNGRQWKSGRGTMGLEACALYFWQWQAVEIREEHNKA